VILTSKAILFDLDGVLVDSTAAVERVWRAWAIEHQLEPERVIDLAHGRRSIETIRMVTPQLDTEKENLIVEQMEIDDKEGVVALPGALKMLRGLPTDRFTIVTSATHGLAAARLRYANLPVPKRLVTANDVVNGKPSPEPYLKGAEMLGFKPEDCLVIEDTPAGIRSAHAAGMQAIGLSTTYPATELLEADAICSSLKEVAFQIRNGVLILQTAI
jgi:mannitol-1-/sugar-/sorbitol-6-phosphatase